MFRDSPGVGTEWRPSVAVASTGTTVVPSSTPGIFLGWHVSDAGGSQCNVRFWDGASPGAGVAYTQLSSIVTVGPSSSAAFWMGPQGVPVASQVTVERISGKSEVVIFGS